MTREEFIKELEKGGLHDKIYSYEIEGDKIIVTSDNDDIWLTLDNIPSGIAFNNRGEVHLRSFNPIPSGVEFRNGKLVWIEFIKSIYPGVVFANGTIVNMPSIIPDSSYFHNWKGNIEGVDSKRLLNLMISKGVFI